MDPVYRLFENSADAVVGITKFQRVCFWNSACERLFGVPFDQVRDKNCHAVVNGSDLNGDVFCRPDCPLFKKLLRQEPITDYDMVIRCPAGDPVVVNVGAFIMPEERQDTTAPMAFLVFRRVDSFRLIRRLSAESRLREDGSKPSKYHLTRRETEVLELAAKGRKTEEIGRVLSISETTVRNHFKKIFYKLGVHTRAEAVSLALRSNFF